MFSDPQKNIEQLGLAPGARVADLGSGAGFYTIAAALRVTGAGRVYAIDARKDMLQKLKNEANQSHILNIEALWGDVEKLGGTRLSDVSVDAVLVCDTLFQIENKDTLALEAKRILKPKGRVLVVDWKESSGGIGPRPESIVPLASARTLFEKAGFAFEREITAGEHHYGIILRR